MENNGNSLAKISIGINVILIIAVIILFVKMPSGTNSNEVANNDSDTADVQNNITPDDGQLRICYFQADSLNNLAMMAELEELGAIAQKNAEDKMRAKDREIQKWQEKWGDPAALLPSELKTYQQQAMQKEQEIGMFQQEVQMELGMQQENLMRKLITRVSEASRKYAEENGYDYVMSYTMGQVVYYGSPNFDVTAELMDLINSEYEANQVSLADEEAAVVEGEEG